MTGIHIQWKDRLHAGIVYDQFSDCYLLFYTADNTCKYLKRPHLRIYHADESVTDLPMDCVLPGSERWVRDWLEHGQFTPLTPPDQIFWGEQVQFGLGAQTYYGYGVIRLIDRPTAIDIIDNGTILAEKSIRNTEIIRTIKVHDAFNQQWQADRDPFPHGWRDSQMYGTTILYGMTGVVVDDNWWVSIGLIRSQKAFYEPLATTHSLFYWDSYFSDIDEQGKLPIPFEDVDMNLTEKKYRMAMYIPGFIGREAGVPTWSFHTVVFHSHVGARWYLEGKRDSQKNRIGAAGRVYLTPYAYPFTPITYRVPNSNNQIPEVFDNIAPDSAELNYPSGSPNYFPVQFVRESSKLFPNSSRNCDGWKRIEINIWDIDQGMSTASALARTRRRRKSLLGLTQGGV